ncbi:MAG: hypothetical protein ACE5E1_04335 [Phycisphaerae bacterium]
MSSRTTRRRVGAALGALGILWAAHPPVVQAGDEKTVTVEGLAAGTDANAMEQAKQDALRRAVEQACGTFISSQTKVKNYAAVYDKAISLAAGYISSYEVLDRAVADGLSRCRVRATVSTASFEREWARLLHTIEAEDNPRCVVVVVEDSNVDDATGPKTDGVVQSVLENFFLKKGLQLMDKGASEDVRKRDIGLAALNDNINKLAAMAAAFKADVVIKGVAEARHAGTSRIGDATLHKWTATITIRAYHTDSAQMLMSNSYSASKTSTNQNAGGDAVLRACAQKHAGKILRDIGEAWRKRQNVRRTCQVMLENCNRRDFKAFQTAMRKVQGVQNVRLKEFVNNVCQIEIDWSYDTERLVVRIEELKVDGTAYEITEQTHDRISVKLIK